MKKEKRYVNIFIICLFILVSSLMVLPLIKNGRINAYSDWTFHSARVQQIYLNLQRGKLLTFIATDVSQHTGVGTFLFYPYLFLYPWAVFKLVVSPVTAFYLWYASITLLTLIISYYSMMRFSKGNYVQSLIFSLVYMLVPYRLYLGQVVLGEFIAATFLPLVFLGLYEILWGDLKKWYLLSIGMSLLVYSHILSVYLSCQVIALIFAGYLILSKISIKRIKVLLYSAILTIFLSLPVVVLFITDFIGKGIATTFTGIAIEPEFNSVIVDSFRNWNGFNIGLILMVTFIIGGVIVRKNKQLKYIYVLGVLLTIAATSVVPWYMFSNTILGKVQLTNRYFSFGDLFLAVIASYGLSRLFDKKLDIVRKSILMFLISIGSVFIFYASSTWVLQETHTYNKELYLLQPKKKNGVPKIPDRVQLDNNNYNYQFEYRSLTGSSDYYPIKAYDNQSKVDSILNQETYINGKRRKLIGRYNTNTIKYRISLKSKSRVDLPVIKYNHTEVYVNNNLIKNSRISDRGTIDLTLDKGMNNINIKYQPNFSFYTCVIISAIIWLLLFIYIAKVW